jgi:hypothetical protein
VQALDFCMTEPGVVLQRRVVRVGGIGEVNPGHPVGAMPGAHIPVADTALFISGSASFSIRHPLK